MVKVRRGVESCTDVVGVADVVVVVVIVKVEVEVAVEERVRE